MARRFGDLFRQTSAVIRRWAKQNDNSDPDARRSYDDAWAMLDDLMNITEGDAFELVGMAADILEQYPTHSAQLCVIAGRVARWEARYS
jgi:hypothetical protein